jgi:hypothetical protein
LQALLIDGDVQINGRWHENRESKANSQTQTKNASTGLSGEMAGKLMQSRA